MSGRVSNDRGLGEGGGLKRGTFLRYSKIANIAGGRKAPRPTARIKQDSQEEKGIARSRMTGGG